MIQTANSTKSRHSEIEVRDGGAGQMAAGGKNPSRQFCQATRQIPGREPGESRAAHVTKVARSNRQRAIEHELIHNLARARNGYQTNVGRPNHGYASEFALRSSSALVD